MSRKTAFLRIPLYSSIIVGFFCNGPSSSGFLAVELFFVHVTEHYTQILDPQKFYLREYELQHFLKMGLRIYDLKRCRMEQST